MNTLAINKHAEAHSISFVENKMIVFLEDGRELSVPIDWFPRLRDASMQQRNNWRLIGGGEGIHWEELDEDISVEGLLK